MERISRFRAIILLLLFILILTLFAWRLFVLQIIETDGNTDNTATYSTITTIRAARGDILDRNGNVLVGNRASYDLVFNHYVIESSDGTNESLSRLVEKCAELGVTYLDHFPVTKGRPFEYTLNEFNTSWQNHFQNFMIDRDLDSDITAPLLIEKLREGRSLSMADIKARLAETVACKAAVKAGMSSQPEEMLALAKRVLAGEVTHCPHGRPVMTVFTRTELDKRFSRIV